MLAPRIVGLLACVFVAGTFEAQAAKLCVDPAKPAKCFTTIQAAIDAASSGDVVTVAPLKGDPKGYRENVVIATSNLTLQGKGKAKGSLKKERCPKTILDGCETASDPTGCGSDNGVGVGVTIDAVDVTVRGLTIRHFNFGVRLTSDADRATIRDTCFVDNDDGVFNETFSGENPVKTDDVVVERSLFRGGAFEDVELRGDGTIVRKNIFILTDEGVQLRGDSVRVEENEFVTCNDRCIRVAGASALIAENEIDSGDLSIELDGDAPMIVENVILGGARDAINVACGVDPNDPVASTCTGGLIADNEVEGTADESEGMELKGDNLEILGNFVIATAQDGIIYRGSNGTIAENRLFRTGSDFPGESGIEILGSDNLILDNEVRLASFDGILQRNGDRNTYRGNAVLDSGRSGILIQDGVDNVVTENEVEDSHGEGINNAASAADTQIDDNELDGNRTDVCSDGTVASFTGNVFDTGGAATLCVVQQDE